MGNKQNFIILKDKFFHNLACIVLLILGIMINIGIWVYLYLNITPQAAPIFLHYNIYFGIDLMGEWYWLYLMPAAGVLIFFINLYFSYIIYKREKSISVIILSLTLFIQLILLLSSYLIVRQNI